jgi:hypothetical protein
VSSNSYSSYSSYKSYGSSHKASHHYGADEDDQPQIGFNRPAGQMGLNSDGHMGISLGYGLNLDPSSGTIGINVF